MKDYALKIPDQSLFLKDRTGIKNAVAGLFGDRHDGTSSRYLYSQEPLHEEGAWLRVRVLGDGKPVPSDIVTPISFDTPKVDDEVSLACWVALKPAFPVSDVERAFNKIVATGNLLQSAMDISECSPDGDLRLATITRGRDTFKRGFARLKIKGRITDQNQFMNYLKQGIGPAKAYGFGLVAIEKKERN